MGSNNGGNALGMMVLLAVLGGLGSGSFHLPKAAAPASAVLDNMSSVTSSITKITNQITQGNKKEEQRQIWYLPAGDMETARNFYKDTSRTSATTREPYYKPLPQAGESQGQEEQGEWLGDQ